MDDINFFAETTARGQRRRFGIKLDDRRRHMYVIGKTGMGKSQMLQNMAVQDIQSGKGVGIIDPHGEFAEALLDYVPKNRVNDVIYFNPADVERPIGFNIMESVGVEQRHFIAAGLMAAFKKIWVDVWSSRMEYILNNALLALLEYPNATIMGANRMLADKEYRKKVVDNVKDPAVKSYWINEFAKYPERYREESVGAIQNKIGQFISNPLIRNIIGQTKSTFNVREIMDGKKILIINLSKGRIGEDNTALLGTMLITKLQIAAMSRVDTPEDQRNDFFLYVDEFQTFATPSFAGILSEARKYRLSLILAHQYIAQMDEIVRDAVFGNAGTLVAFRIGAADAEFVESEFTPAFLQEDLVNLPKFNIAVKLMIDGITSHAFSAMTFPPIAPLDESNRDKIIRVSSERFGKNKGDIEGKIARWSGILSGDKEGADAKGAGSSEDARLYDAVCSECGKNIKVTFEPDGVRPVYCKDCLAKKMRERAMPGNAGKGQAQYSAPAGGNFKPGLAASSYAESGATAPDERADDGDEINDSANFISLSEALQAPNFVNEPVVDVRLASVGYQIGVTGAEEGKKKRGIGTNNEPHFPRKLRKNIDLAGLRESLKDIMDNSVKKPQTDNSLNSPDKKNSKPKEVAVENPQISGIMKEGEEVEF